MQTERQSLFQFRRLRPWTRSATLALPSSLCLAAALLANAQEPPAKSPSRNETPIPPPAWQRGDAALAAKWRQLTGRYIYQRACTECHAWGPDYWPRSRWENYFKSFPENHAPDVRNRYKDLTAMFDVGKAVPTLKQEEDALTRFVLESAPSSELPPAQRERKFSGFPEIGAPAPDFAIIDVQGRKLALSQFKDKRALVLVFSRAHW